MAPTMANAHKRTIVLGSDQLGARRRHPNALFARTPLDLIQIIERDRSELGLVLLAGDYVHRRDVAEFIHDEYPELAVSYEHVEKPRPVVFLRRLAFA